jgi:hypothetical protein
VRRIIIDAERKAEELMRNNLELLHRCSKALMERETLDSSELDVLIQGGELRPIIKDVESFREKLRNSATPQAPSTESDSGADEGNLALSPS